MGGLAFGACGRYSLRLADGSLCPILSNAYGSFFTDRLVVDVGDDGDVVVMGGSEAGVHD